ncbi:Acyl-CoA synthetase (AMP-forming)/AMP-acid ligase II [Streptomyces sp. yr375]|uniref:fatty acyl-AMP ligase n=1 Tax=Streptomyces sp. yr375 TaxID=1761906 RepID=UPI0008BDEEAD|nr:fatty acyl-AMP ligase [Streptomyces sp. yr375]SES48328.1 Acyl-CoA synthetase (AMP-forming)/AMP-acid ligase II [Streptomyces sp. yr375]
MSRPDVTLAGILDVRARCTPHRPAFRFLADGTSNHVESWTYRDLKQYSDAVAEQLRSGGHSDDRVVLAGRPGLRFVAGLMGILQVGATAVPAFPPTNRRAVTRLRSILADCAPGAILADARHERRFAGMTADGDMMPRLIPLDDEPPSSTADGHALPVPDDPVPVRPTDIALIQYSSGSTGDPKGVELTHANLMSNCQAIGRHIGAEDDRVGLTWLPPYHDMGLIGTIMLALHGGWPLLMMTPEHFVQQPARWLRAIAEHRVTITVAPNFAFQLCADTVDDEDLAGVDLSSLRHVFCGSEPIVLNTLNAFRKRFAPLGYREQTLIPCYGLAEATLLVTAKAPGTPIRVEWVDREELSRGRMVDTADNSLPTADDALPVVDDSLPMVGCGGPAEGHELLVVDPDSGRVLADGEVGEIWVRGPNVAAGYHRRPELTSSTFGATPTGRAGPKTYLRTGDLGCLRDGELFVTGRMNGLLVVAGRNIYPQDIERTVDRADPSVHRSVAFALPGTSEEHVMVVAEVRDHRRPAAQLDALRGSLLAAVASEHGVRPAGVHLVRLGTIPMTTSGKIRRGAARTAYLEHTLGGTLKPPEPPEPPGLSNASALSDLSGGPRHER